MKRSYKDLNSIYLESLRKRFVRNSGLYSDKDYSKTIVALENIAYKPGSPVDENKPVEIYIEDEKFMKSRSVKILETPFMASINIVNQIYATHEFEPGRAWQDVKDHIYRLVNPVCKSRLKSDLNGNYDVNDNEIIFYEEIKFETEENRDLLNPFFNLVTHVRFKDYYDFNEYEIKDRIFLIQGYVAGLYGSDDPDMFKNYDLNMGLFKKIKEEAFNMPMLTFVDYVYISDEESDEKIPVLLK